MIDIRGLVKSYGSARVLDGVEATVAAGEIVSIVGASGCGKSTLLRCLNGLEEFQAGDVTIAGFELRAGPHSAAELRELRGAVGMVFQDFQLFPHMTALENVTLAPRLVRGVGAERAEREARELLARVGLAERAGARPAELSGGQKQRVAIARALAQGARVLLLDEPTSALDPEMRKEVRDVLSEVAHAGDHEGRPLTLLLVTHDLALFTELSTSVWLMERGRIVQRGTPGEIGIT